MPSWRLKLYRAVQHLAEIEAMVAPLGEVHDYAVTEHAEEKGYRTYKIWTTRPVDPLITVAFGDFLFNVRSALDHIAVSLVPEERETLAAFPILEIDPDVAHSGHGEEDGNRRRYWSRCTTGMPAAAIDVIRSHQPFKVTVPPIFEGRGLQPADAVLAILNTFQNADKHRRLVTVINSLIPSELVAINASSGERTTIELPDPFPDDRLAGDGAAVYRDRYEIRIEGHGIAVVAAGVTKSRHGPYRRILDYMPELLRVATVICDDLEAVQ